MRKRLELAIDLEVIEKRNKGTYEDSHPSYYADGPAMCLASLDVSVLLQEVKRLQEQRNFFREHAKLWRDIAYRAAETADIGAAISDLCDGDDDA